MTARLPKSWGQTGSKMRNRGVWECKDCGTGLPDLLRKKHGCCPCGGDLFYHASQKEFTRWKALQLLEKAGQIRNLRRQVRFPLQVNGHVLKTPKGRNMVYTADFTYEEMVGAADLWWCRVVEDTKGRKAGNAYELFHLKREILRANGVEIRVT